MTDERLEEALRTHLRPAHTPGDALATRILRVAARREERREERREALLAAGVQAALLLLTFAIAIAFTVRFGMLSFLAIAMVCALVSGAAGVIVALAATNGNHATRRSTIHD